MYNPDHVETGRELVAYGGLRRLRKRLGYSRSAMAEMLCTAPLTYIRWESEPGMCDRMWESSAERLGRFNLVVSRTLAELDELGIDLRDLTPLHLLAMDYGLPQELMIHWYREGKIHGVDLGILGLWIHKDDLHYLREAV